MAGQPQASSTLCGVAIGSDFMSMECTKSAHTTEFLTAFTTSAIQEAKNQFGVQVIAIVTDGAANMVCDSSTFISFCMPSRSFSECN